MIYRISQFDSNTPDLANVLLSTALNRTISGFQVCWPVNSSASILMILYQFLKRWKQKQSRKLLTVSIVYLTLTFLSLPFSFLRYSSLPLPFSYCFITSTVLDTLFIPLVATIVIWSYRKVFEFSLRRLNDVYLEMEISVFIF